MLFDAPEVFELYKRLKAYALLSVESAFEVGVMVFNEKFPSYMKPFSYEFFETAAKEGHVGAIYNLGMCYRWGEGGVFIDIDKAMELFQKAAELGHENAQKLIRDYSGDTGRNILFQSAISGAEGYGSKWFLSKEMVEGYYERAEAGDGEVQYELARQLADPKHIGPFYYNIEEAIKWYTAAGENGVIDAMFNLARIYQNGSEAPIGFEGCKPNLEKAEYWFTRCAEAGDKEARDILRQYFTKK